MGNKRIVSAITPSGTVTLGNYLGAIKPLLEYQNKNLIFLFVADLHSLTNVNQNNSVKDVNVIALYQACGFNSKKVVLFRQSAVPAHTALAWVLLTHTTMGELSRMTQFKTKLKRVITANHTKKVPTGLFAYPTLMASDILLYNPTHVVVGNDQVQHLELTRILARRFNHLYGKTFVVPQTLTNHEQARIMSLCNPKVKMSKSDSNPKSYVSLLEPVDSARKKIMSAVTDSENKVFFDPVKKPGVSNLLLIYAGLKNVPVKEATQKFKDATYYTLKSQTADAVVNLLTIIQQKYNVFKQKTTKVVTDGNKTANQSANQTMQNVYEKLGVKSV